MYKFKNLGDGVRRCIIKLPYLTLILVLNNYEKDIFSFANHCHVGR
jgi:hypothetical protein